MSEALKECPFCKCVDGILENVMEGSVFWVECRGCGTRGPCNEFSHEIASRDWNTRANDCAEEDTQQGCIEIVERYRNAIGPNGTAQHTYGTLGAILTAMRAFQPAPNANPEENFANGVRWATRQVFALHEDTIEQYHDLAEKNENEYARGRCVEAKSIARAMSAVEPEMPANDCAELVEALEIIAAGLDEAVPNEYEGRALDFRNIASRALHGVPLSTKHKEPAQ